MPFHKTCLECKVEFIAAKNKAKYCCQRCFGLSKVESLVERNKARRKYPEIEGVSRRRAHYLGTKGADSLRDVEKRHNLLIALGGECVTCGYNKDLRGLVLDHKNGDGADDRVKHGSKLFRYYVKNLEKAVQKLQVLCATCNQIKAYENREHNKSRRVVFKETVK
jgi:hypothetical protein